MIKKNLNALYAAGFIICIALLGMASYMQLILDLKPCPLCIMQRLVFLSLGILFFLGWIIPWKKVFYLMSLNILILLTSGLGLGIALRQIYLQWYPERAGCGPGLNFMFQHLPLKETVKLLFIGSADCGQVQWQWMGLSIPYWTAAFFAGFCVASVFLIFKLKRS